MNIGKELIFILIIFYWLVYSAVVIIYLNFLTRKYLMYNARDSIVGSNTLVNYYELTEKYKNKEELNILVLTGGGIRGLIPLKTLSYIEQQLGKPIGELFDFFSGSSTGAISALCFTIGDENGNYKYSATYLYKNYIYLIKKIFYSPLYHQYLAFFGLFAPRYLPDNKMNVLESFCGNKTIGELKGNILIPVYNIEKNVLQIVKNWSSPSGPTNENYLAKDLINGASSPPMLFSPISFKLKGKKYLFIDPCVVINNPVLHVSMQVKSLFPNKKLNIVLIGNGDIGTVKYDYRSMFGFGLYGLYQYIFNASSLNNKLYQDFMDDYFKEEQLFSDKITYTNISVYPRKYISPSSTSATNINKLKTYSQLMLDQNKVKIDNVITMLKNTSMSSH